MVLTRSRSRQAATATSLTATSVDSQSANSDNPPTTTSSSPDIYNEQCWKQRTVRLTKHASSDQSIDSPISRQRLDTADRYLTLTCRQHSPRTREYIVRSDAPLLNSVDYVVAALTALIVAWLALVWPARWMEPHTALVLLPLAVIAASKLQTVKQGRPLRTHSLNQPPVLSQLQPAIHSPRPTPRVLLLSSLLAVCRVCSVYRCSGRAAEHSVRVWSHHPPLLRLGSRGHSATPRGHQLLPHRGLPRHRPQRQEASRCRWERWSASKRIERE